MVWIAKKEAGSIGQGDNRLIEPAKAPLGAEEYDVCPFAKTAWVSVA